MDTMNVIKVNMKRSIKYICLFLMLVGINVSAWGDAPTLSELSFSTPIIDEDFNDVSTVSRTTTVNPTGNLSGYGVFDKIYNNSASNTYTIENSTFSSNSLKLSQGSGSALVLGVSGKTYGTKGAFRFRTTKTANCYVGICTTGPSANAYVKAEASVYIRNVEGTLSISKSTSSGNWQEVGAFTSTTEIEICVIYNNTNSAATYGNAISLGAKKAHVYVNGTCVTSDGSTPVAYEISGLDLNYFKVSAIQSEKNVAYIDDIKVYDALPTQAGDAIILDKNNSDASGTTGGTASILSEATAMSSIVAPTRTGYSVAGYYTAASDGVMIADANGDLQPSVTVNSTAWTNEDSEWQGVGAQTFYAYWTINSYTVSFNANGGDGTMDAVEKDYNTTYDLPACTFTRPTDKVFDHWAEGSADGTSRAVGYTHTVTEDITYYAVWRDASYTDYAFSCSELTLTKHLVTEGTPIFITSTANKKVRSQDYITISGNGLTPNQALTFPGLEDSKFEVKTATGGAISTDENGEIDVEAYIFYTPGAGDTSDGLDKLTGVTINVEGAKPKSYKLDQPIIGRHLPTAGYVIAGKKDNKWYALPSDMTSTTNPKPSEIAVDDFDNPSIAYTAASNIYGLEGPTITGTGNNLSTGNSQYVRLTMSIDDGTGDPHAAPLFGSATGSNAIGKSGTSQASSNLSAGWWWKLQQTNTSITNPQDAKYKIYCANNTQSLSLRDNAGNPDWGLFASGVKELRLIPASDIPFTEAYFVEWGQHGGIVEVDAANAGGTGQAATSVIAHLGEATTSSAITLVQTGTSVKGSATKYNYTVNFGDGIDFAAHDGELLLLEWKNDETVKAMTSIYVPRIIAADATMSSIAATDGAWGSAEVHVLPGVTLTANAGDFNSKNVTIDQLEIYPGATVVVTKGDQDVGTLDVRKLILRNGWTRVGEKSYDVARLYINTTANLTKTNNTDNWYSEWYIDYDQYYPIAVPFPVSTSAISYKNTNSAASAGVTIRYYDGAQRAAGGGSGSNWKTYKWDGTSPAMPATLDPCKGYAITAKRPAGKAFSIVRMPLTFRNEWTALGEQGSITVEAVTTHKDQVTVTAYGKGTAPWYAMGWNFIANPYMSVFNGNDAGITGYIIDQNGGAIKYASIPDREFKDFDQVNITEAALKPSSGFFVQGSDPNGATVTFSKSKIIDPTASSPARYTTDGEAISEQEVYIRLSYEGGRDLMGLIIGDDYSELYEVNADLAKMLGEANTVKTYLNYNNMDFAYLAVNATLAQAWIPVTVRIPADGTYTYSLHDASRVGELEGIYLMDYLTGQITNLLDNNYTFTIEAGTTDDRFALNAIVGERQLPTDMDVVELTGGEVDKDKPVKFIYHDQVYILYQNVIYNATGKKVRTINR